MLPSIYSHLQKCFLEPNQTNGDEKQESQWKGRKDGNKHLTGAAVTVLQQHWYRRIEMLARGVANSKTTNRLSVTTTLSSFTKYLHWKCQRKAVRILYNIPCKATKINITQDTALAFSLIYSALTFLLNDHLFQVTATYI